MRTIRTWRPECSDSRRIDPACAEHATHRGAYYTPRTPASVSNSVIDTASQLWHYDEPGCSPTIFENWPGLDRPFSFRCFFSCFPLFLISWINGFTHPRKEKIRNRRRSSGSKDRTVNPFHDNREKVFQKTADPACGKRRKPNPCYRLRVPRDPRDTLGHRTKKFFSKTPIFAHIVAVTLMTAIG